jgi:hypothetical protein
MLIYGGPPQDGALAAASEFADTNRFLAQLRQGRNGITATTFAPVGEAPWKGKPVPDVPTPTIRVIPSRSVQSVVKR